YSGNIVHRLLRGKGNARCLRVKTHKRCARVLRSEPVFHDSVPNLARCPILGNLLKEVIVRVKEEAEPRAKLVYIEAASSRPFHVLNAVIQRKGQLLQCRRASFANVIAANRNG